MGPDTVLDRLLHATNSHDLDAVVACFARDYVNSTPVHPARGFDGREQVRRNWQQIFDAVPDLTADVVRRTVDGDVAWSEWEMRGTRADGSAHLMRGVILFGIEEGLVSWARFYLEPVDTATSGVDVAVRAHVGR